jgi:pantoate--beta-alanine ligase
MKVFTQIINLTRYLKYARLKQNSVGLIPTMGSLHKGHSELIKKGIKENDVIVSTIYVNPLQFNNKKDLEKYPRDLERDLRYLKKLGCHAVFAPADEEMYSADSALTLNFGPVENILEGKFRPGHFAGVGIVISKLFNIVQPDKAYFGLKDIQQCYIIRKLVSDLSYKIRLRFIPTVREKNGVAISSRNERLSSEGLQAASGLYAALKEVERAVLSNTNLKNAINKARNSLKKNKLIKLEYLEAVNPDNFSLTDSFSKSANIAVCIAAYVEEVRLIDNIILNKPGYGERSN